MPLKEADLSPIHRQIAEYDARSLVLLAIEKLQAIRSMDPDQIRKWLPWNLLLIIKWAHRFSRLGEGKEAGDEDLIGLMNTVYALTDEARGPGDFGSIDLFLKNMAVQQFWVQTKSISGSDWSRQISLLRNLSQSSLIAKEFQRLTSISLDCFFELSLALTARFMAQPGSRIDAEYFAPFASVHSAEAVDKYLELISIDFKTARPYFEEADRRVIDLDAKLWEQSALRRKPLLRLEEGREYACYSPNVLYAGLAGIPCEVLKAGSPEFATAFGEPFEDYVGICLKHVLENFLTERDLKVLFPAQGKKIVDYAVPYPAATVLFECKAVELSPHASVSPDPTVVRNHLRTSVIKAINQGLSVANDLSASPPQGFAGSAKYWLIVVTLKDLFLGRSFLTDEIHPEVIDYARKSGIDASVLPPDRVYFLSLEDLELLVAVSKFRRIPISEILDAAARADAGMERKLLFRQHLDGHLHGIPMPSFVVEPFEQLCRKMQGYADPDCSERR
ncbi:MAG: hypothetical protein JST54_01005 [Deltaproteobacteria bacterium]|nr:hypothetical protein [Deltaproteobacteria bacterium]